MRVVVKKWGNSASVRIPAAIMDAAQVRLDQQVDVREERGRIIIEPVCAPAFDLADLVAGITDENRHAEIESGGPVGNRRAGLLLCCRTTTKIKDYPFEVKLAGHPASVALADQVKSFDWRARKARKKGQATTSELAEIRAKLHALIG